MQNFTSVDLMILSDAKLFLVIFVWVFFLNFCFSLNFVLYAVVILTFFSEFIFMYNKALFTYCKSLLHIHSGYTRSITPTFDHQFIQCNVFYYHTRKTRWLIYICDIRFYIFLRFGSFSNGIKIFFVRFSFFKWNVWCQSHR